jgi:hypothetical protein
VWERERERVCEREREQHALARVCLTINPLTSVSAVICPHARGPANKRGSGRERERERERKEFSHGCLAHCARVHFATNGRCGIRELSSLSPCLLRGRAVPFQTPQRVFNIHTTLIHLCREFLGGHDVENTTEGLSWGYPRCGLGALGAVLEPFCGHLSPKVYKIFQK